MNFARVPRAFVVALALLAGISFIAGMFLDYRFGDFLSEHQYTANMLSGLTGFSVSAVAAAVAFSVWTRRARVRRWSAEMEAVLRDAAEVALLTLRDFDRTVPIPGQVVRTPVQSAVGPEDDLVELLGAAGVRARDAAVRARVQYDLLLLDWFTDDTAHIGRFSAELMKRIEQAYECGDDGSIVIARLKLESSIRTIHRVSRAGRTDAAKLEMIGALEAFAALLRAIAANQGVRSGYVSARAYLVRIHREAEARAQKEAASRAAQKEAVAKA